MNKTIMEKMRKNLLMQKEKILKQLASENDDFQKLIKGMDSKDLADIAASDIDRATLETLGSQDMRRLTLIDAALVRIENGRYGVCLSCGKKIPTARLEAIPHAFLCIECKSSEERKNR